MVAKHNLKPMQNRAKNFKSFNEPRKPKEPTVRKIKLGKKEKVKYKKSNVTAKPMGASLNRVKELKKFKADKKHKNVYQENVKNKDDDVSVKPNESLDEIKAPRTVKIFKVSNTTENSNEPVKKKKFDNNEKGRDSEVSMDLTDGAKQPHDSSEFKAPMQKKIKLAKKEHVKGKDPNLSIKSEGVFNESKKSGGSLEMKEPTEKKFIPKNKMKGKFNNVIKTKDSQNWPKKPKTSTDASDSKESTEKTDWVKLKLERKELKVKRKAKRGLYDVANESKKLYEKLKCKKTDMKTKENIATELYCLLKTTDSLQKVVMAHDTARVIQCLFKYSPTEVKKNIVEQLLSITPLMATSRYAQYCILRMFKHGDNSMREAIIKSLYGNIVKLTSNAISSKIIDTAYLTWATADQKIHMKQEFYGDIYKNNKDVNVKTLSDTYKNSDFSKTTILEMVKSNLVRIANKKLMDNSLVHTVLLEYLEESSDVSEIVALYFPLIPSLITTKDGCRAAIMCFWHSPTKDRRSIVKSLKEHMLNTYMHEQGHVLLLAIINTMDDTKAIKKVLFDPILPDIENVMTNKWGRTVIEWFVSPGSTTCFHPQLISFLDEGLKYSKKDKEIRRREVLEQIEEPLTEEICKNAAFWLQEGHIALVTANILKQLSSEFLSKAAESVAQVVCDKGWKVKVAEKKPESKQTISLSEKSSNQETVWGIEDAGLHVALKKIIKQDKERVKVNTPTVSSFLVKHLNSEKVNEWIKLNRACFILLNILENCDDETKSVLEEMLKVNKVTLKDQTHTGAKLLIKKLSV